MESRRWAGDLAMAPGWALFVGQPGENSRHAHQALQIGVSLGSPLEVCVGDRVVEGAAAIALAPNVVHAVESGHAALLYVDPADEDGRRICATLGANGFRDLAADRVALLVEDFDAGSLKDCTPDRVRALRDGILGLWIDREQGAPRAPDPRVAAAIARIRERVDQRQIPAKDLAREIGISPSRLRALFRQQTGVAIRPYVLWARLQRAIETVGEGASLTEAAFAAGFADSAHLARTFRRMFGTTLSASVGSLAIRLFPG